MSKSANVAKSRRRSLEAGCRRFEVILRDPVAIARLAELERKHGTLTRALTVLLTG